MPTALDKARERGTAWAVRALTSGNDRVFVTTGKVSALVVDYMVGDIRSSATVSRGEIERAFVEAAQAERKLKQGA